MQTLDNESRSRRLKGRQETILFSPKKIGNVEIKNRLIRSATGTAYAKKGLPTPRFTQNLADLATGGIGMIISGIAMVSKDDSIPFQLHAFKDKNIKFFKEVREAVRRVDPNCKLFSQIGHTGHRYRGKTRIGPSNVSWPGDAKPMRQLNLEEIQQIVEDFAQAIRRFKESGWDGVQIHGGHGYLISSFLSPYTNKRKDKYGGSVFNRTQIIREIMDRSRELVGDEFPIIIKINSDDRGGSEPEDLEGGIDQKIFIKTAKELTKMKVDAIEVSGNHCVQTGIFKAQKQSYFKKSAGALDIDLPIILTGGNRNADDLNTLLKDNITDFIGICRPLIREPYLPNRWLTGETSNTKCISCDKCSEIINLISGMRCHIENSKNITLSIGRRLLLWLIKKSMKNQQSSKS